MTDHDKPMSMVERVARAISPQAWEAKAEATRRTLQAVAMGQARAAIAAMGESENPWRPMSSAPKDGTAVDLMYPYPRGRTTDCQWNKTMGWHRREPCWEGGELLPESEWSSSCYPNMQPYAWMPRPPRPDSALSEHQTQTRRG